MTMAFAVRTIFEIFAVLFVVFAILNEDKLIVFEKNVSRIIKRKIKLYRRRKAIEKRRAQNKHLKLACDRGGVPVRGQNVA